MIPSLSYDPPAHSFSPSVSAESYSGSAQVSGVKSPEVHLVDFQKSARFASESRKVQTSVPVFVFSGVNQALGEPSLSTKS